MAEQAMERLWRGRKYRLYLARRNSGFMYPGIHLWTGSRHRRILPLRNGPSNSGERSS